MDDKKSDLLTNSHFSIKWKEKMSSLIKLRYGEDTPEDKIEAYLNDILLKKINNIKMTLFNNYKNKSAKGTALEFIDLIFNNHLIMAGGGTLFLPHEHDKENVNLIYDFIRMVQLERVNAKKKRAKYEKGTYEYFKYDIEQEGWKLIINALYGCLGYAGFALHNLFIAEAITNQGRHIITTAINTIEGFFGDGMFASHDADLYKYIDEIKYHYDKLVKEDKLIKINSGMSIKDLKAATFKRLIGLCKYKNITDSFKTNIANIVNNANEDLLNMLYYKNNLAEFNQLEFIKPKVKCIIDKQGKLDFCERWNFNEFVLEDVDDLWQYYETYVFLRINVFDRIRKAAYMDKIKCLYTDTDSVFVSLDELVKYVQNTIYDDTPSGLSDEDLKFTAVNLYLYYINLVIDEALNELCIGANIAEEYHHLVAMKNEFFIDRILFIDKKKRYIALARLQEGKLLNGGKGAPEIKGFDFKKSVTKDYLRKYYTNFVDEEILYCNEISPRRIFKRLLSLKLEIDTGVRSGDAKYYKQSNVKEIIAYKKPYSQQGITSTTLWNALVPDHKFDLPTDVNIAPIKPLTFDKGNGKSLISPEKNKNVLEFKNKYPEAYEMLFKTIYSHENPEIRHMSLSSIALPKNVNIEIPQYIYDLIDYEMITTSALKLILPVTKVIGIKSLPVSSTIEHMSNVIEL